MKREMSGYIKRDLVVKAMLKACGECRDSCIDVDGIFPDCHNCLLNDVKEALPGIPDAIVAPVSVTLNSAIERLKDCFCKPCEAERGTYDGLRCKACQIDDAIGCIELMIN